MQKRSRDESDDGVAPDTALLFAPNQDVIVNLSEDISVALMDLSLAPEKDLSIAPEKQSYEYFLQQLDKDRVLPTFKKVFCIKRSNWNVEEEVWFRDLDADPKYPLHKYFVLHIHFHKHRAKTEDIDMLNDLAIVDAANMRNLTDRTESRRRPDFIDKLIAGCPYSDTLIHDNAVHIFPPKGELGRCTNCNKSIEYDTTKRCKNRLLCQGLRPELKIQETSSSWQCEFCKGLNKETEEKCRHKIICPAKGPGRQWEWQKDKDVDKNLYALLKKSDTDAEWWDESMNQHTRGRPTVTKCKQIDTESLEKRIKRIQALCIGIGEYEKDKGLRDWRLPNASNDAQLLRDKLIEIGANVVLIKGNTTQKTVSKQDMFFAAEEFAQTLACSSGVEIVFCYIGCHGYQIDGKVYLLPSDFPFHKMDSKRISTLVREFGLYLQELITPIDDAVKNLKRQPVLCLYLVDCCRNAPEGTNWRGIEELCFDKAISSIIFSCKGGQEVINERQNQNGPFALEMVNQLFEQSKSVGVAIKVVREKLMENYKQEIEIDGPWVLIGQAVYLTRSNRFALSAFHMQNIIDIDLDGSSTECAHTESESEIQDLRFFNKNEGLCGGYFKKDITQSKFFFTQLLDTINKKRAPHAFASLLILITIRHALKNDCSEWSNRWNMLCRDVANKTKNIEEMIRCFNETIYDLEQERRLGPRMERVVLHFRKSSSSSAFKFIVHDQLKYLVGTHPVQQNQIDFLANAVHDDKCTEINFSTYLDKFIINIFEEECEAIPRHSITIPRKSFACLFKVSRLFMTLIYETIRIFPEMALEMSNAGVVCLFSSFKEYIYIPLGVSAAISPTSHRPLFESMSHLTRLSSFELHLLAKYEIARQIASSESSLAQFISSSIDDTIRKLSQQQTNDRVTSTANEKGHSWTELGDRYDEAGLSKRHKGVEYDHASRDVEYDHASRQSEV